MIRRLLLRLLKRIGISIESGVLSIKVWRGTIVIKLEPDDPANDTVTHIEKGNDHDNH